MLLRDPKAPGWSPDGDAGTTTQSETVARTWEAKYLAAWTRSGVRAQLGLDEEEAKLSAFARPLGELVDEYLVERGQQGLALATVRGDRTALRCLLDWYGQDSPLARVVAKGSKDRPALKSFLDGMLAKGYELSYAQLILGRLKPFLRAYGNNAADDIVLRSRASRGSSKRKRGWTDEEIKLVREGADFIDSLERYPFSHRLAVEVGLGAGLRLGELFAVRWSDYLWPASRKVHVREQFNMEERRPTVCKGGTDRLSFVLPSWWAWHRAEGVGLVLPGHGGDFVRSYAASALVVDRILREVKLKQDGESAHMLRHTYARLFLKGGGSLYQLKVSLGHSSIVITESAYDHYATESLDDLERIFYTKAETRRSA